MGYLVGFAYVDDGDLARRGGGFGFEFGVLDDAADCQVVSLERMGRVEVNVRAVGRARGVGMRRGMAAGVGVRAVRESARGRVRRGRTERTRDRADMV